MNKQAGAGLGALQADAGLASLYRLPDADPSKMQSNRRSIMRTLPLGFLVSMIAAVAAAGSTEDARIVAAVDTLYQEAVKNNDAVTMDRILLDDFVLVNGKGNAFNRADPLQAARSKSTIYEHQEEEAGMQQVRVFGDTAVVTAKLWIKAKTSDRAVSDRKIWFSDTYIKNARGPALLVWEGVDTTSSNAVVDSASLVVLFEESVLRSCS